MNGTNQAVWIVGDVHGAIFTLERLLAKISKDARVIFVGDLVDKGNYSKEVFELVTSSYETIFGNHEFLMFNYIRDAILRGKNSMWNTNPAYGGAKTVRSYQNDIDALMRHIEIIPKLPKYMIIGEYFITHGFGLPYYRQRDTKPRPLYVNRLEKPFDDWEEGCKTTLSSTFLAIPFTKNQILGQTTSVSTPDVETSWP